jgi:hypothetical protein
LVIPEETDVNCGTLQRRRTNTSLLPSVLQLPCKRLSDSE